MKREGLVIGIDAANMRRGGGVTHLIELLSQPLPADTGIDKVVIWAGKQTLNSLKDVSWLLKRNPDDLDKGLLQRTSWQHYRLSQAARDEACDVLFVPGGSYVGDFRPVVTMSQNLLPFDTHELLRYGWSLFTLKMLLLRWTQSRSFRKSDGIIFLSTYARDAVMRVTGPLPGQTRIIPHGLNPRFSRSPRIQRSIGEYDDARPYRLLYVSIIDQYKHQWHVAEAVVSLRKQGMPIILDLVGPAYPPALKRLNAVLDRVDPERCAVKYHGAIPYSEIDAMYAAADMGIWASTCETFGIIILEAMAAGLPVACSKKLPMPEVVADAAVYFNPECPDDIAKVLQMLLESHELRSTLADSSRARAELFSWSRCSRDTFDFLAKVARQCQ